MIEFNFTFKGMDSSEAIKNYAEKKFKKFEKYFEGLVNVQVVFKREKFRELVEVIVSGDGENIVAKEETSDIYEAIDLAYETLEKQIKKFKEKRKEFRKGKTVEMVSPELEKAYIIQTVKINPMSTQEALEWFEKNKDNFMLFYNTDYDKVCLIYSEKDKPVIVVPEIS
ncbi:MAG: ribosomal subunit interface protein [Thermodesulfobacterium geofontis]|uniref:Ribosome hibernation promoting factor n=1 Tax=Thermodesulfobacterium geofontis TaxID=1295609 RepID=A0A2N7PPB0_9BACT|nr:MAG: ribosomal subunit interface protein [Thermodesulfobacterium geofontis]